MKKLIVAAVAAVSSLAFAGTWEVDSAHASAGFTVKHMMISNVSGRLGDVKGTVEMDEKDMTKSKVDVSIDVGGINTGMAKRDEHLKSPDFFDVAKNPTATFKSTKIEKAGDKYKVTGDLTMHGMTKPVTLDAEISAEMESPFMKGMMVRAVSATGTINREDWGLGWNKPLANNGVVVSKDVKLTIDAEIAKKPAAAPAAPAKAAPAPAKK